jgi:hypothetical protein
LVFDSTNEEISSFEFLLFLFLFLFLFFRSICFSEKEDEQLLRQLIEERLAIMTNTTYSHSPYSLKYWLFQMQLLEKQNIPDFFIHAAYEALNQCPENDTQIKVRRSYPFFIL